MAISAAEQYALELVNRARLDPAGEARRYGIALDDGLAAGTITTAVKQPLASTAATDRAAEMQANWMGSTGYFTHRRGDALDSAGDRLLASKFSTANGVWRWGENLTADNRQGASAATLMEKFHISWLKSPGHREEIFATNFREMSQAWISGSYNMSVKTTAGWSSAGNYDSLGVQVYAAADRRAWITGVAYSDSDKNDFYSVGEARAGLAIAVTGVGSTKTAAAGGYSLGTTKLEEVTVRIGAGSELTRLTTDLSGGNVKIDVVDNKLLKVSADVTLLSGPLRNVTALGVDDIDLTGNSASNRLTGNSGKNVLNGGGGHDVLLGMVGNDVLRGGSGNDRLLGGLGADVLYGESGNDHLVGDAGSDRLFGGTGADQLNGGNGNDRLDGGTGNDVLTGGNGADQFVFARGYGRDRITDFDMGEGDMLYLSRALPLTQALRTATITAEGVVLTFGEDQLIIAGIRGTGEIRDHVVLF